MRLRTRLAMLFGLLALAPLVIIIPFASRNLHRTLMNELEARSDTASSAAREELARTAEAVQRSMAELASTLPFEDPARASSAGPLMKRHGLNVLTVLTDKGVTLSSGHLPARAGDVDSELYALARREPLAPEVQTVQVGEQGKLLRRPALLVASSVKSSEGRLWLVGGTQLDLAFVEHLSRLTGAAVTLISAGETVALAGEAPEPSVRRVLPLSPRVSVILELSQATVLGVESGLGRAAATVVTLGLGLAVLLGFAVARVITRPVEALADGARRVARGDWETPVAAPSSGELSALIVTFNEMAQTLRTTTARLVSAERLAAWQEIAKRLAHELKNPLTPIRMSLETLVAAQEQKSPRFAALFAESSHAMLEELDRLRRTVDAFSSFARLPKLNLAPLDLTPWVRQLLALHGHGSARLELKTELTEGLHVLADRDPLTQVLVNLLKNADEAMPHGGRLTVRTLLNAQEIWIEVEDQGGGVPESSRAQLFTPYFTTKQDGTGLGLALSARICQEHGGSLELDPHGARGGALFRVRLPAVQGV